MTGIDSDLRIEVVPSTGRTAATREQILNVCDRAYGEDSSTFFDSLADPTHVLGFLDDKLVCHAIWVTRWLQAGDGPLLRTAYVELVATDPGWQGRGFATAVMEALLGQVQDYDLAALNAYVPDFYARRGWLPWRGPLFSRGDNGPVPTSSDESIMIMPLPKSPQLDLDAPLSVEWREGVLW